MIERVAAIGIVVGVAAVRCLYLAVRQPTPVLVMWYRKTNPLKDTCNTISVLPD
jgi:hypothetical protein